jgi:hypothetical protein
MIMFEMIFEIEKDNELHYLYHKSLVNFVPRRYSYILKNYKTVYVTDHNGHMTKGTYFVATGRVISDEFIADSRATFLKLKSIPLETFHV